MGTEVIKVDTIAGAVERILQELKEDNDEEATGTPSRGRHNVIYFDGWGGLGASAVLREVGRRLIAHRERRPPAAAGLEFSQVIHIDCSKWESRRAMQRALAEQLQLPAPAMTMFDTADEDDDYQGVGKGSRREIPKVAREIFEHVQKQLGSRFLVIFNNGSCEEIDLENLGFPPLSGYSRNKALWTFQGGFRLHPRWKVEEAQGSMSSKTDVLDLISETVKRPIRR
ncbi:hypothetical protein BS78_05G083900 [Paspalum vaginatum]|nr:hypothetical protein BS78_05G083900 [Paspalum vaginatum]